jgi:hypothetical protein
VGSSKSWYKSATGRAPKPLQADLKAITESYRELFRHRDLSDTPLFDLQELPSFDPIDNTVPSEEEIEDVVKHLKLGKAPGPSGIRNEHLRDWLAAARREKEPNSEMWNVLVQLIQMHQEC